jgi:hypothetical protein
MHSTLDSWYQQYMRSMASESSALLILSVQTVLPVPNSPKLFLGPRGEGGGCYSLELLRLTAPPLNCLSIVHHPSITHPQSHFRSPALIGYSHFACVYLSSQECGNWQLYTTVYEGPVWGSSRFPKLGSLQRQCMQSLAFNPLRA